MSSPIPTPLPAPAQPEWQPPQVNGNPPPHAVDEWDLTSAELEIEEDSAEVETARAPQLYAPRHAPHEAEAPESAGAPIPLVRPVRR
jgi:hypothetical protein